MERKDTATTLPTLGDIALLPTARIHLIIATIIGVASLLAFYPTLPTVMGKSLAGWTWFACNEHNGFLHGRLVPLIIPWLVYVACQRSKHLPLTPSYLGLIPLFIGLFFFWAGLRLIQPRVSLLGIPFIILGVIYYLAGASIAKRALFPAFFLYFAIPIPGLYSFINGYLDPFIHNTVSQLREPFGFEPGFPRSSYETASDISLVARESVRPGLFFSTLMAASVLSYLTQRTIWKQWFLVTASILLLVLGTIIKLLFILFLFDLNFQKLAHLLFFDFGSILILLFTSATLFLISQSLKRWDQARATPRRSGGE